MARTMGLLPGNFEFTRQWFQNRNLKTFVSHVLPVWADKPIEYLEIGVFEGMSMTWMLQRILTHVDSRAYGIDPWLITRKIDELEMEKVRGRAIHNTSQPEFKNKCTLIRGNSVEVLNRMISKSGYRGVKKETIDICMVDGDHNAQAVVQDAECCMKLMKPGGWLLFDDVENRIVKKDHVKQGLEIFLVRNPREVKLLWKDRFMECYQVKG